MGPCIFVKEKAMSDLDQDKSEPGLGATPSAPLAASPLHRGLAEGTYEKGSMTKKMEMRDYKT
jgi:hypothetical protein